MPSIITTTQLAKTYASGLTALHPIDLEIRRGEILALLGPNGAGTTTLISILCGIVTHSAGSATVDGHDILRDYRAARSAIGLVPQELHTDMFETVWDTTRFSRGLFGLRADPGHLEQALRRDMWVLIRRLREDGVTVILTTHYIAEAEEMADRVGVIHRVRLILVEDKATLMRKLGRKQLMLHLQEPLDDIPDGLREWDLELAHGGTELRLTFQSGEEQSRIPALLRRIGELGIEFRDLNTRESSLEEIFVDLLREG